VQGCRDYCPDDIRNKVHCISASSGYVGLVYFVTEPVKAAETDATPCQQRLLVDEMAQRAPA
jgi:hypothetical protein